MQSFSESVQRWRASGEFLSDGHHQIFVRRAGSGPALLLLHGFPTSAYDFKALLPGLESRFSTLCFDFLGYGLSDKPAGLRYSVFAHADQTERLLERFQIQRYVLFAHDYGDTVAQELLARELERGQARIRGVCFLNGGLAPEMHRPRLIQRLLLSPLGPILARAISYRAFRRSFLEVFAPDLQPTEDELRDLWALIEFKQGLRIYHKLIGYIKERRRWRERWVGALQNFPGPMRLVNGALDPVSGRHLAEHIAALCPRLEVAMLDHVGHYPQLEAPEETLQAFLSFSERLPD